MLVISSGSDVETVEGSGKMRVERMAGFAKRKALNEMPVSHNVPAITPLV